jgi:hypothetical protein
MRFCSYQRTASANSAEAGWLIRRASPPENVSLDAALDVLPRFERDGPGFDGIDATLNLSGPCRFGVWICRTIEACQQFRGQLGADFRAQAKSVSEEGFGCLGHGFDLTSGYAANTRLEPAASSSCARIRTTMCRGSIAARYADTE